MAWRMLLWTLACFVLLQKCTAQIGQEDRQKCKLDLLFILDGSQTVCSGDPSFTPNEDPPCDNWELVRELVSSVVEDFIISREFVQVGAIVFGDNAQVLWDLNDYLDKDQLQQEIEGIPFVGGNANTQAALNMAVTDIFVPEGGDRADIDNIVIVVTDGKSNVQSNNTIPSAERLRKDSNALIFAVGITIDINEDELKYISSPPHLEKKNYFQTPTFANLQNLRDSIVTESCKEAEVCRYMDLAFIIDGSGSICKNDPDIRRGNDGKIITCGNWNLIRSFTQKLATSFEIGADDVRVAMVLFGDRGQLVWNLNRYTTEVELINAIEDLEYKDQNTNTSGGLLVAADEVFVVAGGDRANAPNIAIVITDGRSTYDSDRTIPSSLKLKSRDVSVFSVGITQEINETELRLISSQPQLLDQQYFKAPDFDALENFIGPLINTTCGRNVTDCQYKADMVFILDSSGSVGEAGWQLTKQFVKDMITEWPTGVGEDGLMVGIVVYSTVVNVVMELGASDDVQDLLDAVEAMEYLGGRTNTAGGLMAAKNMYGRHVVRESHGYDVAIVITDGISNVNEDLTEDAALELQEDAQVYVVGVTADVDEDEMKMIASPPSVINKNYWKTVNYEALQSIRGAIQEETYGYLCSKPPEPKPEAEKCELDIALIVDASGSIQKDDPRNWDIVKNFLKRLTNDLNSALDRQNPDAKHRIALVRFSSNAYINWTLDRITDPKQLSRAIDRLPYDGHETNTPEAFRKTVEVFKNDSRPTAPNVAILLTDGIPYLGGEILEQETVDEAEALRDEGVKVLAVGVAGVGTHPVSNDTLRRVSSHPQTINKDYWLSPDFSGLYSILQGLVQRACVQDETCDADVVLVLDYSGSIGNRMFLSIRDFASAIVNGLDIGESTRVGAISFSDETLHVFHLNTYNTRKDAAADILGIDFKGGWTNTAGALNYARTEMFKSSNGDRRNVPNFVVILTDGGSNRPSKEAVISEAQLLKKDNVHVIAVGVGKWLDIYELNAISSYPYSVNTIILPDYRRLRDNTAKIIDLVCNAKDECANDPCSNGGTCTDGTGVFWCHCQRGYVGRRCRKECREQSDVVFALDASGSVKKQNFQKEVDFVSDIILHGLSINNGFSRVGALDYSTNVRVAFNLEDFDTKSAILSALSFYYYGGSTNTADAIRTMGDDMFVRDSGDRRDSPNVGVVITDGRSDNPASTWQAAMNLRSSGTDLLAVGVGTRVSGSNVKLLELEGIASRPIDKNIFTVDDFGFQGIGDGLIDAICNNENDCRNNPCENRGTCNDLRGGYSCRCRDDYTGRRCERGCSGELDLVFVLDRSGSMRRRRFYRVIDYVVQIVQELEIASDRTRVGLIAFSEDAVVQFQLNDYSTMEDMTNRIKRITYVGRKTNTAEALRIMTDDMFTSGNGDRRDVQNMAIVITNANSNVNRRDTLPEAIRARVQGIHIVAVGVGSDVDWTELRGIASYPASRTVFHAISMDNLPSFFDNVVQTTCNDVDACDNDPCDNGRCNDLMEEYYCACSSNYVGRNCDTRCPDRMDIAFVLDISGSVDVVYHVITNFTRRMIHDLPVQQQRAKVAIVTFSDVATIEFSLDTYQSKQAMLSALAFTRAGGSTNTPDALNKLYSEVFLPAAGDRNGIDNKAVLVTDGKTTVNRQNTRREADAVKDAGIELFVVAVGNRFDRSEVDMMSSDPDSSHVFEMRDVSQVNSVADALLEELCD